MVILHLEKMINNYKANGHWKIQLAMQINHPDHPERISKLKPFIKNYNWKDIEFPSCSKDWKKFDQNNNTIALNILYVPYNTKQIRPVYISKYGNKRDNQVILLMIMMNIAMESKIGIILQ